MTVAAERLAIPLCTYGLTASQASIATIVAGVTLNPLPRAMAKKLLPETDRFPAPAGRLGRAFRAILRGAIQVYRYALSPWIAPRCRHLPTCSEYCLEAVDKHGVGLGIWLTLKRLARCHPWGTAGYDPVP